MMRIYLETKKTSEERYLILSNIVQRRYGWALYSLHCTYMLIIL